MRTLRELVLSFLVGAAILGAFIALPVGIILLIRAAPDVLLAGFAVLIAVGLVTSLGWTFRRDS